MIIEILIKKVRETLGISLKELAEQTGIDENRLREIETEKEADEICLEEMVFISEALGRDITELYNIIESD